MRLNRPFHGRPDRFGPRKTVAGCVERISQLYEQGADAVRIGQYVRRWLRWAISGLGRFNRHVIAASVADANVLRLALPSLRPRE